MIEIASFDGESRRTTSISTSAEPSVELSAPLSPVSSALPAGTRISRSTRSGSRSVNSMAGTTQVAGRDECRWRQAHPVDEAAKPCGESWFGDRHLRNENSSLHRELIDQARPEGFRLRGRVENDDRPAAPDPRVSGDVIGGAHLRAVVRESSRVSRGGFGGFHEGNNGLGCLLTAYSRALPRGRRCRRASLARHGVAARARSG